MSNQQLTSRSTEMSQRSYPFINVSGEKIPPFAAMQIVGDPIYWKDYVARTDVQSVDKAFKKIANLSTNQFDNGMQLFCDKPSEVSELLQDASLIAFNGDSEVGIGSGGRCFYSEYPARAAIDGLPWLTLSYAVRANAWYLSVAGGTYGAFRAFCDTQQKVSIKRVGRGGEIAQMRVANVTAYRNTRFTPNANGVWRVRRNDNVPISVSSEYLLAGEVPIAEGIVFNGDPTLTMRIPGSYSLTFTGNVQVSGPPFGVNIIPFRIGIEPYQEVDRDKFQSLANPGSRDGYPGFALYKYAKNTDGIIRPLGISEAPTSGDQVRWARYKFSYKENIRVISAPVRLVMWQDLSPYVYGEGVLVGIFLTDEVASVLPYLNQQVRFGGYYGDYFTAGGLRGYFNASNFPPELFSDVIGSSQQAFPYFHPDDPWVTV